VLYLAIPAHNEVATIGVLLWRIRTVLAEFPREYEVVVYDDASTDATADVASQYEQAMPVTVIRGEKHLGYAGAVDRVLRHVALQTRYPRRDAVLLLQGDFTDPPGIVPEFARRFEGGADLVVGERLAVADAPVAVRRLFKAAQWAMRPFVRVEGVKDTTASMRLVRISALRDAMRAMGDAPLVTGDTWTTNADLLLRLAPHARRVEAVPMEPTYGVRMRETRRVALRDALSALKWAWGARGRRAVVGSKAEPVPESERRTQRGAGGKRREEAPELSVDRLREKIRERDGSRGIDGEPEKPRGRRGRDRERPERTERAAKAERPERAPRAERPERNEARPEGRQDARTDSRPERQPKPRRERTDASAAPAVPAETRPPKPPRGERPPRPRREETRLATDADLVLDDPFAPPTPKVDPLTRALESRPPADSTPADASAAALPRPSEPDEPTAREEASDAPPVRAAAPRPTVRDEDAAGLDDAEDEGDDSAEGSEGGEAAVGEDGEPRRRRRRNRRSRRGRRRREGADATDGEASASSDEGNADGERPAATDRGSRETVRIEGEPIAFETGDAEGDEDGGDSAEDGGDESSQARARRRGRRGRRGGARRSRGRRDRGRGDGDGSDGDGADRPDSPPAGPDSE
jgi:hypothetical protein